MQPELRILSVLLAIATLVLTACGREPVATDDSHVAATVNGRAIIFRQLTGPFRTTDGGPPLLLPGPNAIEALDRLIDQELIVQRAQEMKIDQDPAVMLEIEAMRHRILAQAYVDRNMRVVEAAPEEISRYFREHPVLFEQRRIYYFHELVVNVGREHLDAFRQLVAGSRRIEEVAAWLRHSGMPFQRAVSIKTAEQLPPALLPRLTQMRYAQLEIFEGPGTLSIVQLVQAQPAPVSLSEATPTIEKLLLAEKRQNFVREKARQLREKAEIRYHGPFAPNTGEQPPPVPASANKKEAHINRGLSGLL